MSNETVKLSVGEMVNTASRLARAHFVALLAYVVVLGVIGAVLDMLPNGGTAIGNIGSFVAGYFLYEYLLRSEGLIAAGRTGRSWGSYLGVGLLSGLAILLGFALLIVPGLILLARWSIAPAIVIAEGQGATGAMAASWDATRASQWNIVLFYLLFGIALAIPALLIGFGLGLVGALSPGALDSADSFATGLAGNIAAQIFGAGGGVLNLAIMSGLYRGADDLEAVFA